MSWWWSWALTAVGVTGLYLAGSRRRAGWMVGLAAQLLWLGYALDTRQWGFLLSVAAYSWAYTRNWLRWRREAAQPAPHNPNTPGSTLLTGTNPTPGDRP